MTHYFLLIIIPTIVVFVIGGLLRYFKLKNSDREFLFKNFAQIYYLKHTMNNFNPITFNCVEGIVKGHNIVCKDKNNDLGEKLQLITETIINTVPFDFEFKIKKKGLLSLKGIEFNDSQFDKTFYLQSNDEVKLKHIMTSSIRNDLHYIKNDLKGDIICKNNTITYTVYGGITKEQDFKSNEKILNFILNLLDK